MDLSLVDYTLSFAASQGGGFAKFHPPRHDLLTNCQISVSDSASEHSSAQNAAGALQISSSLAPVGTLAPPPVKSNSRLRASRSKLLKRRRTKRGSYGGDSEDGEWEGIGGDGFDGPFGGDGGGGGRGWNSDRFWWNSWDESSSSSSSDPAFDFVYEVVCWIVLSNCLHFAFKKVLRIMADALGDAEKEKVPLRLSSVC